MGMNFRITQQKKSRVLFLLVIVSVCMVSSAVASNYIRVATIGGRPSWSYVQGRDHQYYVDQLITFWKNEINQVLPDRPDLILLPELCDVPFGLKASAWKEYLSIRGDQIKDQLALIARSNRCYVAYGTLQLDEQGNLRNAAVLLDRSGKTAGTYHKQFPTIGEIEDGIRPGEDTPVFQCDFGTVAFAICFDLNFEELLHAYRLKKPDILLFPSNYHGGIMQNYWAYGCRAFFVGSINGGGTPSEIRNPLGDVVATSTNYFDFAVATINLDSRIIHLDNHWSKLKDMKNKYGREVTILDPGRLAPVLISSASPQRTADMLLKEFNLEPLDSYFDRSRQRRKEGILGTKR